VLERSTREPYAPLCDFDFMEVLPRSAQGGVWFIIKSAPAMHVWSLGRDGETPPEMQSRRTPLLEVTLTGEDGDCK